MYNSIKSQLEHFGEEQEYLGSDWTAAQSRLLKYYARIMPKVFDVERASIFIANLDGDGGWLTAATGMPEHAVDADRMSHSIVGEAIRTGQTIYRNDPGNESSHEMDVPEGSGLRDIICMPIRSLDGAKVTGAVQLLNRHGGAEYTEDDKAFLAEMIHRLEISIESIYFRQEAGGIVGRIYKTLRRVTLAATIGFFAILVAFTIYWFSFFWMG